MSELKAGRELDALVAEKVMGGADFCGFRCPDCGGSYFGSVKDGDTYTRHCHGEGGYHCHWKGPASEAPPAFSEDIAAAWLVVEKMDPAFSWVLSRAQDGDYDVSMTFHATDYEIVYEATADTAPLAICRAALKAVGHE